MIFRYFFSGSFPAGKLSISFSEGFFPQYILYLDVAETQTLNIKFLKHVFTSKSKLDSQPFSPDRLPTACICSQHVFSDVPSCFYMIFPCLLRVSRSSLSSFVFLLRKGAEPAWAMTRIDARTKIDCHGGNHSK